MLLLPACSCEVAVSTINNSLHLPIFLIKVARLSDIRRIKCLASMRNIPSFDDRVRTNMTVKILGMTQSIQRSREIFMTENIDYGFPMCALVSCSDSRVPRNVI